MGYETSLIAGRAFDEGVEYERERIIALLAPLTKHDHEIGECWQEDCDAFTYEYVTALIKGDNK
jgi:hypothetical protein